MNIRWVGLLVGAAVFGLWVEPAQALPTFARRYGVECHFCHDGYPKLNGMGQRFKERGFRMEHEDAFEVAKWIRTVPLSIRPNVNRFIIDGDGDNTSGFVRGISAGNLGPRLSYWIDDGLLITEGDDHFTHTKIDNGWGRLEILKDGKLYLKAGRFELDLPFTQARTPHLFSYDIYFTNTGAESDSIGDHQVGAEIGGSLPSDVHWSAAVVKGHDSDSEANDPDLDKFEANVFLRLAKRIGRNRVGAFAYIGRNELDLFPGRLVTDDILRVGADASVWLSRLNLYGAVMYGRNSDASTVRDLRQSFNGGFAQLDFHLTDHVVLNTRLNVISRPLDDTSTSKDTLSSVFPGAQFFVGNHLKLSVEYGFREKASDFGAVQAEVAF